jgi:NADPH:quinone reductase
VPQPGPGELLIRTEAIGVTLPGVRRVRDGHLGALGGEIAGEVLALGAGIADFKVGDRVTALTFTDAYTEMAVAHTPVSPITSRRAGMHRRRSRSCAAVTSRWRR